MVEKIVNSSTPWPGQIYRDDRNNRQSSIWQKWAINNVNFIDFLRHILSKKTEPNQKN